MLDTVLNLGLNDTSVEGLARATENERFAWDSYRRFVQMFGNVSPRHRRRGVRGGDQGDQARPRRQGGHRARRRRAQGADDRFKALYKEHTDEFPQDPQEQLRLAIRAVFDSWTGERAMAYRRINRIPDDWGTAVNVQQMVFGNKGDTSGSGVAFSRDEVTGAPEPSGDFLLNAQGEDVVSGVRTPRDIAEMKDWLPEAHEQLMEILRTLEAHYEDMQDTEFTVEEGQLYMLQTRNAKRPAQAAVRFARRRRRRGAAHARARRSRRSTPDTLDALLHPTFDPKADFEVLASGVAAVARRGQGRGRLHRRRRRSRPPSEGRDVILVRPFTEANDVAGFHAAKGILTSEGGKASHAALVARGMGVPRVVGAGELKIDLEAADDPRRRHDDRRRRPDRHRRHDGLRSRSTTSRWSRPRPQRADFETRAGVGRRHPPARRARQRRHARRTRARRASSAPRASACAAPSTCSWPRTASRRCGR